MSDPPEFRESRAVAEGGFLSALRVPRFRRLWIGAFLSSLGTWTQDVALNWLVHARFVDPRYLGYRSFAADAPLLAFMLLGGAAADRIDRRRILLSSQVLQMSFAAILGLLYATGHLGVAAILLVLSGLSLRMDEPAAAGVRANWDNIQSLAVNPNDLRYAPDRRWNAQQAATFLLWLLSELFERLPEIGDPDKPKLVFFFDEAHLIFSDIEPAVEQKIEQMVRLIRSKVQHAAVARHGTA